MRNERYLKSIGGSKTLSEDDAAELMAATLRVLELMSDHRWHSPDEICDAAGQDGKPAREGLRRMRELRQRGVEIEKRNVGGRNWEYRMVGPEPESEPEPRPEPSQPRLPLEV